MVKASDEFDKSKPWIKPEIAWLDHFGVAPDMRSYVVTLGKYLEREIAKMEIGNTRIDPEKLEKLGHEMAGDFSSNGNWRGHEAKTCFQAIRFQSTAITDWNNSNSDGKNLSHYEEALNYLGAQVFPALTHLTQYEKTIFSPTMEEIKKPNQDFD